MYSKEISEFLAKGGIKVGDRVKVEYDGISMDGELMPKTGAGSPDTVIIKLKSGYNIGVGFSDIKISKLEGGGTGAGAFPRAQLAQDGGLPRVSIIYTGGTIGSKIDYKTGGVEESKMSPEELFFIVPEVSKIAQIKVSNPFSIPSEEMGYQEWKIIAKEVARELNAGAHGVVVTMGTDTMHYLSAALSFMLQGLNAPVVVTGAQRSSDRGSSDAFLNLICAVQIAAKSDIAEVGICMHSSSSDQECQFIRGTKVRKMHSSRRDAFRPINMTPLAYVTPVGKIRHAHQSNRMSSRAGKVTVKANYESKVALVKVYPNSDPGILDFYIAKGYKGIIIEGTGLGHTPVSPANTEKSWLKPIADAVKKGVVVGMTTQCLYGRVNSEVYTNLRLISGAGAVYCEDMLPETAFVKLGWLLGNYPAIEAAELLCRNLTGEISQRIDYDAFLV